VRLGLSLVTGKKRMRVLLVSSKGDARGRYRFLLTPLSLFGQLETINIQSEIRDVVGFLSNMHRAYAHRNSSVMICVGAGPNAAAWYLVNYFLIRAPFILRLGGAVISEKKAVLEQNTDLPATKRAILWTNVLLNRWLLGKVKYYIVVNEILRLDLDRYARKDKVIHRIPQFIKAPELPLDGRNFGKEGIHLLTVSNFKYRDKFLGTKCLIRMLDSFLKDGSIKSKIVYDICGDGYYLKDLKSLVSRISNESLAVHFHGFVEDAAAYYRNADIFLYFSTFDGLPNTVLEAQAHGLPIVINDFAAFRNILKDGVNAVFFDPADDSSFCRALSALIEDVDVRNQISSNNINRIQEEYSAAAVGLRLKNMVNEVLYG